MMSDSQIPPESASVSSCPATFRDLLASVTQLRGRAAVAADQDAEPADAVSDAAAVQRKRLLLRHASRAQLFPRLYRARVQLPFVLAKLCATPDDPFALDSLRWQIVDRGPDDDFGKTALCRAFCQFTDRFDRGMLQQLRGELSTYPDFLTGGTENHVAMKRVAGYLFAERFPGLQFHHGLTGTELAAVCARFIGAYGRSVYRTSMHEYCSPVYHIINTVPWLAAADFARSDAVRLMARAILDWMIVDYAVNYHHGIIIAPYQRDKGLLRNTYQLTSARSESQWTGWLYWGGGCTPRTDAEFELPEYPPREAYARSCGFHMHGICHAASGWLPHPAVRNLGAKQVDTPYMLWQSRGNLACVQESHFNDFGLPRGDWNETANPRDHMRSVYVAREYAVGAGYRHANIMDPIMRHQLPFMILWRSANPCNWLRCAQPYWYTARKRDGADRPWGDDDWGGTSPFCQMVHWENAAVLLYDIPARDPYAGQQGMGSRIWASQRFRENVQAVFVYMPETMDEFVERDAAFFLREGRVYVAIRPIGGDAGWEESAHPGFRRLRIPGPLVGAAVEAGDGGEYGTFEQFQERVLAATLAQMSHLAS